MQSMVLSVGYCTALLERGTGFPKSDSCLNSCASMCVTYSSEFWLPKLNSYSNCRLHVSSC